MDQVSSLSAHEVEQVDARAQSIESRLDMLTDVLLDHFNKVDTQVTNTETSLDHGRSKMRDELVEQIARLEERQQTFHTEVQRQFSEMQASSERIMKVVLELNNSRAGRDQKLVELDAKLPSDIDASLEKISEGLHQIPRRIAESLNELSRTGYGGGADGGGGGGRGV